jgi:hypothetical protein
MNFRKQGHKYRLEDLNKAYSLGLETGVSVMEKTIGLPAEDQALLVKKLKRKILNDKIAALRGLG